MNETILHRIDIFKTVCILTFVAIIYKVFRVPITHDEVATIIHYTNFSVWEIMMNPDNLPSNHILNTLGTKFFISLLGKVQWAVRLPSVLSFLVFTYALHRLLGLFFEKSNIFMLAALSLFVTNTYFLDFFSLCRGYAMASAFALLSAAYLLSAYEKQKEKDMGWSLVFASLAAYANFTLLVFWLAIIILIGVYFLHVYWNEKKVLLQKIGLVALAVFAYVGLIYTPLYKIATTNQFKFWTSKGFYEDTMYSLLQNWGYGQRLIFGINIRDIMLLIVLILLLSALRIIFRCWQKGCWAYVKRPSTMAFLILILTITVNVAQTVIMKTPNLNGRTALFFYPLFSLFLMGLLSELAERKIKWLKYTVATSITLLAFWHFTSTFTTRSAKEWAYDESTVKVLTYLQAQQLDETLTLKTDWKFHPSFDFYVQTGKAPHLKLYHYDKKIDVNTDATYYYVFGADVGKLSPRFEKVKEFNGGGRWLMKRKGVLK